MWSHYGIKDGQTWHCTGPTVAAPPFNSMDFYGSEHISGVISDYKQVGAYFFQTDGPELYTNSKASNIFWHTNDDGIKAYHSGASVTRAIVWKVKNDPVIQVGWAAREVRGVVIDGLEVIHSRYPKQDKYAPAAIVGGSPYYRPGGGGVDPHKTLEMTVRDLSVEGDRFGGPALLRITTLMNYDIKFSGVKYPDGMLPGLLGQDAFPENVDDVTVKISISNMTVRHEKVPDQLIWR